MRLPCLCDPVDPEFAPSLPTLKKSPPGSIALHLDPITVSLTAIVGCILLLALYLGQRQRLAALERVSLYDPLTGLFNGRFFQAELWPARLRSGQPLAVCNVDLDDLKPLNDGLGYAARDRYIARAAKAIRRCVRRGIDDVVRLHMGGDEFLIVLYAPSRERAERVAAQALERLRAVSISASIGVAFTASTDHRQRAALLESAEAAMYKAKRQGRGRVVVAEEPEPAPEEETPQPIEVAGAPREAVPEPIEDPTARHIAQRTQPYSVETAAHLTAACGGG